MSFNSKITDFYVGLSDTSRLHEVSIKGLRMELKEKLDQLDSVGWDHYDELLSHIAVIEMEISEHEVALAGYSARIVEQRARSQIEDAIQTRDRLDIADGRRERQIEEVAELVLKYFKTYICTGSIYIKRFLEGNVVFEIQRRNAADAVEIMALEDS